MSAMAIDWVSVLSEVNAQTDPGSANVLSASRPVPRSLCSTPAKNTRPALWPRLTRLTISCPCSALRMLLVGVKSAKFSCLPISPETIAWGLVNVAISMVVGQALAISS